MSLLEVCGLTHGYRKRNNYLEVLSQINFTIDPCRIVTIRGESGSGKTTLLLACGGMLRPEKGEVKINGTSLYSINEFQRNQMRSNKIGYVFQTLELIPYLNVLDNLTLHDRALKPEAIDWLERFELADRLRHRPDELSHGQRQRVALIRAIVHQPILLIADEPTGNLDEKNSKMVFDMLRHFADSGGAVLLASHDPDVAPYSDINFELSNGQLNKATIPIASNEESLQASPN